MKLQNLDLNKLKAFEAVAQAGGLGEGAAQLHLTTSAVYQAIKKLEDDLSIHLFYRSGKKYILTDDGKKLLKVFQDFNWSLDQFVLAHNEDESNLVGEIKLGLPLNFSKRIFVPIMKKFSKQYPEVQFFLTIAETNRLLDGVSNFELHFALTDDFIANDLENKIIKRSIFKEELIMICSKDFYKENQNSFKHVKELKELTHLCYARTLPIIQRWYQLTYKKQVKINHFHVIDNVETMIEAIKASMGVGVVPKDLLTSAILQKDFHIVQFKNESLFNELFLVQESNYIPNTLCKKFLAFFQAEINRINT